MGNNAAFSAFEEVVHACYAEKVLTLPLLKRIASAFADQDADSGGYSRLITDGKNLYEIVAEVSGQPVPEKPDLPERWQDWTPEQERASEDYQDAMNAVFDSVCPL